MKILVIFALIALIIGTYFYLQKAVPKHKKYHPGLKSGLIAVTLVLVIIGFTALKLHDEINQPDLQCTTSHTPTSAPIEIPVSATDYFNRGNYEYEAGNCPQAVVNYTKAIELNPNYAQSYNNRAYTNMRLRNYAAALPDLDKAIEIRPNYINALMNRGDLYNYYGPVLDRKKAIEDYNKVIALGGRRETNVCGHKAMAESNNSVPLVFLRLFASLNCEN